LLRSTASTLSVRSDEGLGIGTRNIILGTVTTSGLMLQSRSQSLQSRRKLSWRYVKQVTHICCLGELTTERKHREQFRPA
jgi:hypothetical protein